MQFRNLPIQRKLMAIILGPSVVVLVLTCTAFLAYEFFTFRQSSVRQLSTLGEVIATNSTAVLAFANADDATEILGALKAERHIAAAALYDKRGRLFAQYPAGLPDSALPAAPQPDGYRFVEGYLVGFTPVVQVRGSRRLGTLYLRSDMEAMYDRLRLYGGIAGLIVVVLSLVAYTLSRKLQQQISRPILALVETALAVSNRRDYSVRARKLGDDELGLLTEAFNHMLEQIQEQNLALQRAYDDLRQTQAAIMQQERLRALGQMASGIAHDINNAISPASLYVDSVLEKEPGLSPRAREYLTIVQQAIADVAQTVSRLREFYRQREPQLVLAPVSLNGLVEQVAGLTRARWGDVAQHRGVFFEMNLQLAAGLPPVMCVESEIREALTNLVFNAVDAMPAGGRITITTREVAAQTIEGKAAAGPRLGLEVTDTGHGMDEETKSRCLEPFFTTKGERGTGLGLAMVYGTVRRHGAEIEIDSAPGQGTTIRLLFPVTAAAAELPVLPAAAAAPPAPRRLLLVDDDPVFLRSLAETLRGDGHEIVAANGGSAGIEAFHAAQAAGRPFDAVLSDLGMPHVDGRKVADAVKARSVTTPVFLLTGWGQRMATEGDIPENVDRVLNKPPKLSNLREALASIPARTT